MTNHLNKITRLDKVRIKKTFKALRHANIQQQYTSFLRKIEEAAVIDALQVPDDLVTMNSRIIYEEVNTKKQREVTIVYPQYEDESAGKISLLSPLGMAIFGSTVGATTCYEDEEGQTCTILLVKILYQPEQSGHYLI